MVIVTGHLLVDDHEAYLAEYDVADVRTLT